MVPERLHSKLTFSGHETFPLRHGWLKKSFDFISNGKADVTIHDTFNLEDSIVHLGVGRNMVSSIKFWSLAVGLILDPDLERPNHVQPIWHKLLDDKGVDPYCEHPSTMGLIHWRIATNPRLVTWYWFFNFFADKSFAKEDLVTRLEFFLQQNSKKLPARKTLLNDITCLLNSYTASANTSTDTATDTMLSQLGLITADRSSNSYLKHRGADASLGIGLFLLCIYEFLIQHWGPTGICDFSQMFSKPMSPAKVFLLNELQVEQLLYESAKLSGGAINLTSSAGEKTVIWDFKDAALTPASWFLADYEIAANGGKNV